MSPVKQHVLTGIRMSLSQFAINNAPHNWDHSTKLSRYTASIFVDCHTETECTLCGIYLLKAV